MKRLSCFLTLSATFVLALSTTHAASKMYWIQTMVDTSAVFRSTLTGDDIEIVIPGTIGGPTTLAVDQKAAKIYYGESSAGFIGLARADIDGSGIEQLVPGAVVRSIAIAGSGGKVYWTSGSGIWRADADGGNVEQVLSGLSNARGLSIDLPSSRMYWTEISPARLRRAELDGSGLTTLFTDSGQFSETTVAPSVGKVYWLQLDPVGGLWRANLDGTDPELLATPLTNPSGLDIDLLNPLLYVTQVDSDPPFFGEILRISLAGRIVATVLDDLNLPGQIELDDRISGEPVPASTPPGKALLVLIALGTSFWLLRR